MKIYSLLPVLILAIILQACTDHEISNKNEGPLVIIGGGQKPDSVMNLMVDLSGIRDSGYMFALPMASGVPDSSLIWIKEDFMGTGISKVPGYFFKKDTIPPADKIDSLRNARLIFIGGGDQSRFMDIVLNTPIIEAIKYAHQHGAVIAGTSAGAAVMSKLMITGNQKKHPGLEAYYQTIEADNMEIKEGLGFLENVIIDQHFVRRQRLNRLVSVSIENPGKLCVGIDESTAIIVKGDVATVMGESQVVVISNKSGNRRIQGGRLGTNGLELSVYLPGESFSLRQ
ncbi:MAG: cyanophycinase [Bacteroidales bacterium]